jgi:putative hydrolase of the HAD superfamily
MIYGISRHLITFSDMTICKYIFFDVSNTLLYKPQLMARICETLGQFAMGVDIKLLKERHKLVSEIVPFPSKTSQEFYHHFNTELLLSLGIMPSQELLNAIFANCKDLEWAKFEDTSILDSIPVPVGIISNWDETLAAKLSLFFPVSFCNVVSSTELNIAKPDPALYRHVLDSLDCRPEEVVYVGDSIKLDIIPASSVGMTAVLIDRDDLYPGFSGRRIMTLHQLTAFLPGRMPEHGSGQS